MRSTLRVVSLVSVAVCGCGDNNELAGDDDGSGSSTPTFTIGGTITGLTGDGLVLANNGGDDLTVDANASSFTFATKVKSGAGYSVTVQTQPTGELCTVSSGTGAATADVTSIAIACIVQQSHVAEWTWEGGSDVATNFGLPGVYGTQGTADAANIPGGREQSASWRDNAGNLWLFGGFGVDSAGNSGQLDDLWKYDPTAGEWTWVSGVTTVTASNSGGAAGVPGVYGTKGTASATNVPGGREQLATWVDAQGTLWMFGGEGIDVNGVTGELNDLWKFAAGQWTWMGGDNSVGGGFVFGGSSGVYGTKGTAAPTNVPGGRYGAVTWQDTDGNFWLFGGSGIDSQTFMGHLDYLNDLWKYSPSTNQWTWVAGPDSVPMGGGAAGVYGTKGTASATNYPGGRDAAMSWVDASGNIWMFGGIGVDSTGGSASFLNDLWKYEPATGMWTWVSGPDVANDFGTYGTLGTADAANVPSSRYSAATWIDSTGNLWLLGGQGFDSAGNFVVMNDLWKFDPSTSEWTWTSGSNVGGNNGGQAGVYGTLGTSSATNTPGSRYGIPTWTDASGKLWLFGGMGYDSTGGMGYLNDLWNYQP
ncbi:MAG: kelch repeat-containing protein [Kofleriaceae bacterium]